jgi:uncharacterized OB-fold protein
MKTGTIYTETVVHIAPEAFQKDVPYQVAIVEFDDGTRITARIEGERVQIDDRVVETYVGTHIETDVGTAQREGVSFFRKDK